MENAVVATSSRSLNLKSSPAQAVETQTVISLEQASLANFVSTCEETRRPQFWCSYCQKDLQSAKCLQQHDRGRKHRKKAGAPSQATVENGAPSQATVEDERDPQSYPNESIHAYIKRCIPELDDFGCLVVNNEQPASVGSNENRETSREAVVAVALYNYELFNGLPHETASFDVVNNSSAGIHGWASSVIEDTLLIKSQEAASDSEEINSTTAPFEYHTRAHKSDDEESQLLQRALLESVGVRVVPLLQTEKSHWDSEAEEDGSSYYYDYDDDDDGDDDYIDEISATEEGIEDLEEQHCAIDLLGVATETAFVSSTIVHDISNGHDESWSQVSLDNEINGLVEEGDTADYQNTDEDWFCVCSDGNVKY